MHNDDLKAHVEAVLSTADSPGAPFRPPVAPFITNALALRVYNEVQQRINSGTCVLNANVAHALVLLDLTGVVPPDDRGEQELVGQRWYEMLFHKGGHRERRRRDRVASWGSCRMLINAHNAQLPLGSPPRLHWSNYKPYRDCDFTGKWRNHFTFTFTCKFTVKCKILHTAGEGISHKIAASPVP